MQRTSTIIVFISVSNKKNCTVLYYKKRRAEFHTNAYTTHSYILSIIILIKVLIKYFLSSTSADVIEFIRSIFLLLV